jgi:hypothetical protein
MMQEHGTFTEINMNHELGATDVKQHILSGFFNGSKGLLFWCGMDFAAISMPPYEWIGMETRLGLLKTDYTPKPVAFSIKECQKIIEDIGELPDKEYEVACYVGEGQDFGHNFLDYSVPAFVLTKQSGLDIKFYSRTNREIPDAKVYLYPGIVAWSGTGYVSWQERIMEKVREGAIFYISFDGGFLHDFEELTGLVSHGHSFRSYVKSCVLDGEKFSFSNVKEMRLENRDAEVICETEDHNVLFARKRHGKGYVYFNAMGIEKSLYNHDYNAFTLEDKANYYKFYDIFMKDIAKDKPILCRNKNVLVTHHKTDENEYIVSAINYSRKEQAPNFRVKEGMTYEMLYGKFESVPANGTVILKVKKI